MPELLYMYMYILIANKHIIYKKYLHIYIDKLVLSGRHITKISCLPVPPGKGNKNTYVYI